jgi:hypothetical protein
MCSSSVVISTNADDTGGASGGSVGCSYSLCSGWYSAAVTQSFFFGDVSASLQTKQGSRFASRAGSG